MEFILIIFLTLRGWEAGGLTMQEFTTKESCEKAKSTIMHSIEDSRWKINIKLLQCIRK
jgi:hypothetical protein